MTYFRAPIGWQPSDPNPFSDDGSYGFGWSCFFIDGVDRRVNFCGGGKTGPYTFRLGADSPSLWRSLADFLRYEGEHGRQVILSCPDSMELDPLVDRALQDLPGPTAVRPQDPKWVVHSTTSESWASIRRDGCVKSLAALQEEGKKISGLGRDELGEPVDYADYVVLGRIDEVKAEHVVSSRQKRRIVTEADVPYQPGVRLYFDNHRIIAAGLATRDGLHLTKVRNRLPLSRYMVASVRVSEFPSQTWTPRAFWEAANALFIRKVGARTTPTIGSRRRGQAARLSRHVGCEDMTELSVNSIQAIRTAWDSRVEDYAAMLADGGHRARAAALELAAFEKHLPASGVLDVLDAGCGPGFHGRRLLNRGHRVTFADVSPEMLKEAARSISEQASTRATFLEADIRDLIGLPDASFDAAISGGTVISDCGDPRTAVAELSRVLKPDGVLVSVFVTTMT